jgi:hypothetical protein
MIIDTPVIVPPFTPQNRPVPGGRPGGGSTAVLTESDRPLNDAEESEPGRRNEPQGNTESRPGRSDADLATFARLAGARGKAEDTTEAREDGVDREEEPSARASQQVQDRLASRMAVPDPEPAVLRFDART